jgi:hypothetical protein
MQSVGEMAHLFAKIPNTPSLAAVYVGGFICCALLPFVAHVVALYVARRLGLTKRTPRKSP